MITFKGYLTSGSGALDQLERNYFRWLCNYIDPNVGVEYKGESYLKVATHLFNTEFTWFIPNDDNRCSDGKQLREEYFEFADWPDGWKDYSLYPCSILEMLVMLSVRIENMMMSMEEGPDIARWFWEMLSNIGLTNFPDYTYEHKNGEEIVSDILEVVINREYRADGFGGLFPIENPKKDQTRVEIWYQMQTYIEERYADE